MQYSRMSVRQSVTPMSLASNGLGARGLLPCSLHQVRPQFHLLSLCTQLEYLSSPDAREEVGNGRTRKVFPSWFVFPHESFWYLTQMQHFPWHNKDYYTFYLPIYFHAMGQSLVKTVILQSVQHCQGPPGKSQPSAPVCATSQSKTHTTDKRFPRSSLAQRPRHGKAYTGYTSAWRNWIWIGQKKAYFHVPSFPWSKAEDPPSNLRKPWIYCELWFA